MDDWRPSAPRENRVLRAQLNRVIREFFEKRGVLEVETPILSEAGNTEPNIESFQTEFHGRSDSTSPKRWMRTSPEFMLKRMLAAGYGDCYELGRVFRDGEAGGRHNPEFTMLEWYRMGWTLDDLIEECVELMLLISSMRDDFKPTINRVTFQELYQKRFNLDPFSASIEELREPLSGIEIDPLGLTRDDWLDLLMTHHIQPSMEVDELWIVTDFPATQAALARIEGQVAKRFEIYWNRLEIANGYDELIDANEQYNRFRNDQAKRVTRGQPFIALDERLIDAIPELSPCSGVAIGVDRLMMILAGTDRIRDVIAFDFARS